MSRLQVGSPEGSTSGERIGQTQLDERLPRYTQSSGLAINLSQEVDGKINIDALCLTSRAPRAAKVDIRRQVRAGVVQRIEARRPDRPLARAQGSALPLPAALA